MADGFVDSRTNKDKVISWLKDLTNSRVSSTMLKTRAGQGISPATAYKTKMLIDYIQKLTPEEQQEISAMKYVNNSGKEYEFKWYVDSLLRLAGAKKEKVDIKNVGQGADQYSILVKTIKERIEEFLLEQEAKIDNKIREDRRYIQDQHKTLSRVDFLMKFGEKKYMRSVRGQEPQEYYSLASFEASNFGILLRLGESMLPAFILKAQKAYRDKEYGKIDKLVYKLKSKYPNLSNFTLRNYRRGIDGIEFTILADSDNGVVDIYTQTIYAGGYNIQRLHLRWLMTVSDSTGKRVKIEQG